MEKYAGYSKKFKECFEFFDQHGAPGTRPYSQALKAMPFAKRFWFMTNFMAFFFSFVYYFVKGLWKQGLVLVGITVLLSVVVAVLPQGMGYGVGVGYSILLGMSASYQLYLKEIKGVDTWNPFKGIGWR